jgi:branched-chain amino acid transport system ATP-binding protein
MSILKINIEEAGYGKKVILSNLSLEISKGEVAAFIGPNGAGKSTLLKVIMNLIDFNKSKIFLDGKDISNLSTEKRVVNGISFVPQGNRVFTELTVKENLEIGGYLIKNKKELHQRIEEITNIFPDLSERLKQDAGNLSGGEKQQLALARAIMLKPEILLLDEPSLGLSPNLVNKALNLIKEINKNFGTTILIVEQKVRDILKIADAIYAFKMGEIIFSGKPGDLSENEISKIFLV